MPPSSFEGDQVNPDAPSVAIVAQVKGKFYKPLYEALANAQPAGWKTLLLWPQGLKSEHPPESIIPEAANLEVLNVGSPRVPFRKNKWPIFLPNVDLWHTLERRNVQVILIHEYSLFTLGALFFALLHGIPLVASSEVGWSNRHFFSARIRAWHAFWGRWVDGIVACCPAARRPLSGAGRPTIATYHAVDSRDYLPVERPASAPSAPVVFAFLGQLTPRKGIDLLLQAAACVRDRGVNGFKIRLIGGGDEAWVRHLVHDLALEAHVELTGFLSGAAIREALGTADVFVLPTREDTYAAVVHEAACLGLPLLVSQHAGAAEALVQEGENGLIFDPADVGQFADCLTRLMDPTARLTMGPRSRMIAESCDAPGRGKALWEWLERNFAGRRGGNVRRRMDVARNKNCL